MASVEFVNVTKTFENGFVAVAHFSLAINDGELLVLVGPSGCGKSTALRILAGLEIPTSGEVRIDGRNVVEVEPRDRDIAMVFQTYALYPHMTVAENIGFGLGLHHVPKDEITRRVNEAAELLGLVDELHRRPGQLSGGQRQRVAMGRAIVREPKVFLMDEPLSNLDAKLRVHMRSEIGRLQNRLGTTTLYVTHDQVEAMTMGDRVAVMDKGRLLQVGTPKEVYVHPINSFVAGFLGSPAMNFVEGALIVKDEALWLALGEQQVLLAPDVLANHPSLRHYLDGRPVLVGARPEHFEDNDIAKAPLSRCITADFELVEELGPQSIVHMVINAKGIVLDEAPDLASEPTKSVARLIGSFDPKTTALAGQHRVVAIETERLHFFDPDTGLSL